MSINTTPTASLLLVRPSHLLRRGNFLRMFDRGLREGSSCSHQWNEAFLGRRQLNIVVFIISPTAPLLTRSLTKIAVLLGRQNARASMTKLTSLHNDWEQSLNRQSEIQMPWVLGSSVMPSLRLSHEDLPAVVKPCFLCFSLKWWNRMGN